jgi:hypothetical protein
MSVCGLQIFNTLSVSICGTSLAGDSPPDSLVLATNLKPGQIEQTWLLDSIEAQDRPALEQKLKEANTKNECLVTLRAKWVAGYGEHLRRFGIKWATPAKMLEVLVSIDSGARLSEFGLQPNQSGWPSLVSGQEAKFLDWQNEWIGQFFLYDETCYRLIDSSGTQLRIPEIPKASVWLSSEGCRTALRNEIFINWIYSSKTNLEYWWRVAVAGFANSTPAADDVERPIKSKSVENEEPLTLRPIFVDSDVDERAIGFQKAGRILGASYDYGYASGQRDLYERVYDDFVAGRLVAGVQVRINHEKTTPDSGADVSSEIDDEKPSRLSLLNEIAKLLGFASFQNTQIVATVMTRSRLGRKRRADIAKAIYILKPNFETSTKTKKELIEFFLKII